MKIYSGFLTVVILFGGIIFLIGMIGIFFG